MNDKVDLAEKLRAVQDHWSPKIVAQMNDHKVEVVKVRGEFVWHKHDDSDDLFLVLDGRLTIQLRDRDVELDAGQLFVVPRASSTARAPTRRPARYFSSGFGTPNTGDAGGELTATEERI